MIVIDRFFNAQSDKTISLQSVKPEYTPKKEFYTCSCLCQRQSCFHL
jgi:hypothetical protein